MAALAPSKELAWEPALAVQAVVTASTYVFIAVLAVTIAVLAPVI